METPHFYIQRYQRSESGEYEPDGPVLDLEEAFPGLRYKSLDGGNGYGEPSVYAETFVDDNMASVYVSPDGVMKQTELTLNLYFFGRSDTTDDTVLLSESQECYHSFMSAVSGVFACYWDNVRQRKALLYLSGATSPKTDKLYGIPYKEVSFKFTNVYGCTFELDAAPWEQH